MAKTIIHLVHGTWPYGLVAHRLRWLRHPDATWFHEDSPFCRALRSALSPDVTLRPFEWSGNNSYLARHVAAQQLGKRLYECYDQDDPPRQILIAHSHGGNVAMLAALHPLSPPLAGIATLGTPFLHVERRTKNDREQRLLGYLQRAAMVLTASFVLVGLFAQFGLLDALSFGDTSWSRLWSFARENAVFVLLLVMMLWGLAGVAQQMDRLRAVVGEAPIPIAPRIAPWLILRAPSDEAGIVLAGSRLAHMALAFAWRPVRALLAYVAPALRHDWFMPFLLLPLAWVSSTIPALARILFLDESWYVAWRRVVPENARPAAPIVEQFTYDVVRPILDVGAPFAAAGLAMLLLLGAILFVAGLLLAPFGWELLVMGLAFDVTAETTPAGDVYPVLMLPAETLGLRHSVYELPEARARLAQWITSLPTPTTGPGARLWTVGGVRQ